MLDTTPPTVSYAPNEPVTVTFPSLKNKKVAGRIIGIPYENKFGIVTYDIMVEGNRVPRVHYLIEKYK
jgi:hypothetical protein